MVNFPLRERLQKVANLETNNILHDDARTRDFHFGRGLTWAHYTQYLIELVHRIYVNNQADSYLLYRFGAKDRWLAREFSSYLAEEWMHDDYLIDDLKLLGVTIDEIHSTPPQSSTTQLMDYLYSSLDRHGPIASVVWSWYQQWYSDQFDAVIIRSVAQSFGAECTKGAEKHMQVHIDAINRVAGPTRYADALFAGLEHVVATERDLEQAESHLHRLIELFGAYLKEISIRTKGDLSQRSCWQNRPSLVTD